MAVKEGEEGLPQAWEAGIRSSQTGLLLSSVICCFESPGKQK